MFGLFLGLLAVLFHLGGGGGGSGGTPEQGQPRSTIPSTTANATTTGREVSLPRGRTIEYITVVPNAAVPHGRLYAWVELVMNGEVVGIPWSGYVTATAAGRPTSPSAFISIPVLAGMTARLRCSAGTNGGSVQLDAIFTLSNNVPQYGQPWFEAPGSGSGELRVTSLGDPAAGAEFATVTVGAQTRVRLYAFHAALTTAVAAGNRLPTLRLQDATANEYLRFSVGATQGAALAWTYSAGLALFNDNDNANNVMMRLPEVVLPAGHSVVFVTVALDVGDNWSEGFLGLEEWAVP